MSRAGVPVTVVSGLDALAVDDLVTSLLLRHDRLAAVSVDPARLDDGVAIVRTHDSGGRETRQVLELEHGCASCAISAAVRAVLAELAGRGEWDGLVVQLHPGFEPDAILRALTLELATAPAGLDTHVAVLGADWLDVLSGAAGSSEHGARLGDDRFAAQLICAQIESATTLLVGNHPSHPAAAVGLEATVLDLLAPAAVRLRLRHNLDAPAADLIGTGRFDPDRLDPLAEYGIRDRSRALGGAGPLALVRWHADRPLHPQRLFDSLDELADGVIRSSGRLDVADQPHAVVGWDSAGESLLLGPIARCRVHPTQRRSTLAFLGDGLDGDHIRTVLDACLLDDAELAAVRRAAA